MEISVQVEDFCGVMYGTSEQHVDARLLRVQRDDADVAIFLYWFLSHCPFPIRKYVISICTRGNWRGILLTAMKCLKKNIHQARAFVPNPTCPEGIIGTI